MQKKHLYFVLILSAIIIAQGCSLNSHIKKADKQYAAGEYFAAGESYRKLFSKIPAKDKELRARIAFNQAECSRILNYSNAEPIYNNAIRFGYADSLVFLRYAQALQRNAKYKDASKNYSIFFEKDSLNSLAQNGIKVLEYVEYLKANPTAYTVKKFDVFNARRSYNFCPTFLNADADVLFFSSNRLINNKVVQRNSTVTGLQMSSIYSARKNAAGKWEKPEAIGEEINSKSTDNGACCFTPDGTAMLFTRATQIDNSDSGTQIMVSNRAGGTWSEPKKLTIFKDSTISVGHPAFAPDGETLYFVSDSPHGRGGKDIWKAKYQAGECKEIENLGKEINTEGDEMFPTVRYDGTLYFSSNGHAGLGGLDIFKAVPLKNNHWQVSNMGVPINSNGDDFGMTFEAKLEKGYFTSNRGETRGYDAIWSFELPQYEYVLEGKVVDENQNPIPDALVKLVSNTGLNVRVQSKKDGTYRIKVDKDMQCVMMASARGYLNKEGKVSTTGMSGNQLINQDFKLSTIYKPIQVENIFYEFGKWDLTPASEKGLKDLINILTSNPNITIEISAHTDYVGNQDTNKQLSEKRAKSVVDYLIAYGIPAARLSWKGYGEDNPFVVDAATATKYSFLKENDVLSESFVTKLQPDQQEIANQINRRTEFRVLKTTYK